MAASSNPSDLPSVDTKKKVLGLIGIQARFSSLELQYKNEIDALDRKYLGLYNPLFGRRAQVINGYAVPSSEDIAEGEAECKRSISTYTPLSPTERRQEMASDGIPHFWLRTLDKNPWISSVITEKDEAALKHLTDVNYGYLQVHERGFKLTFTFSANEFFTNTYLYKMYYFHSNGQMVDRAVGCEIYWKEGKNLTRETRTKTRRDGSSSTGTFTVPSFFDFFSPPMPPSEAAIESGRMTEKEFVTTEDKLELDYRIGKDLKDKKKEEDDEDDDDDTPHAQGPGEPHAGRNVFFDIVINGEPAGRIVCALWDDVAPMTVRNFRQMATGELGFGYKGSLFTSAREGVSIEGGTKRSIYGGSFNVEKTNRNVDKLGILTMVRENNESIGSLFHIKTGTSGQWQYGFGEVVQGFDIAQKMHNLATTNYASKSESPSRFYAADVFTISECGLA